MPMVETINATEVRKGFSRFVDQVVHEHPAFVRRNRDLIAAMSLDQLSTVLHPYRFHMDVEADDNGLGGTLREIDVVAYAVSIETLKQEFARELVDYATQYMDDFQLYYRAPNRKSHLPYVLHVLLQPDLDGVANLIDA